MVGEREKHQYATTIAQLSLPAGGYQLYYTVWFVILLIDWVGTKKNSDYT